MKTLCRLLDPLLIRAISWTGVQVYGLGDVVDHGVLPEVLVAASPRRRLRFALP